MENILFFDIEAHPKSNKIIDIGASLNGVSFHHPSPQKLIKFSLEAKYLCGHNIIHHDLDLLRHQVDPEFFYLKPIDTLFWSALLFPEKPYHHLVKDYKLYDPDQDNNPLTDALLAEELLKDLVIAFYKLDISLKVIFYHLLRDQYGFAAFFEIIGFSQHSIQDLSSLIETFFWDRICSSADLPEIISNQPVELAYVLSLINTRKEESIFPAWVIHRFPVVSNLFYKLRSLNCHSNQCTYCQSYLDPTLSLKKYFGYPSFRKFSSLEQVPLQEEVVKAALDNQNLLAIFPTGGGKSLAFQLPALMLGQLCRELTVVISPLQSLMKDQVDNLQHKFQIVKAVTINGLLSPLERKAAFEQVSDGRAQILYISPESLRSPSVEELLTKRSIGRFVIDESHCFSSWGHDFRVDYLYIGEFIKKLQQSKRNLAPIQISCFTATAKPQVIQDIIVYFQQKLGITLKQYKTGSPRKNLSYKVIETSGENEKFQVLSQLLEQHPVPTIVYVSRTKRAEELAQKLKNRNFDALSYHGKMDIKEKIANQDCFMKGEANIVVATNAFGMGVDKENVGMVIHYNISSSLENYVQETGRAGRDASIQALCYVLFDENDINKHFSLHLSSKTNQKEIAQIWRAIKYLSRNDLCKKSAIEIAKAAGWDVEMKMVENKVRTSIAVLEEAQFLIRTNDSPRVFANSFLIKNISRAIDIIRADSNLEERDKKNIIQIIHRIVKDQESRTDYLADFLGIPLNDVSRALNILKQKRIIGQAMDLTAYLDVSRSKKNAIQKLTTYLAAEKKLLDWLKDQPVKINLREINTRLWENQVNASVETLQDILRYWNIQNFIHRERINRKNNIYKIQYKRDLNDFQDSIFELQDDARKILSYLVDKKKILIQNYEDYTNDQLLEFSVEEIMDNVFRTGLYQKEVTIKAVEEALLFLNHITAIGLEGGFLIYYKPMNIERIQKDNKIRFSKENYQKLESFYQQKIEQIHIVKEYAKKLLKDYEEALIFVNDYFSLDYNLFLDRYFPHRKKEICRPITPDKFEEIYGSLSIEQTRIVKDNTSKRIFVSAGPGSGKTKVLVHKIASLVLLEDVKPEQFLMLTFSRSAALEFKQRLKDLIDERIYDIDIFTFHAYCFHLYGQTGSIEKSDQILSLTLKDLEDGVIEKEKMQIKSVLVLDEFQDMSPLEHELILQIIKAAESIRVIAVGDDDQIIYDFRQADINLMKKFLEQQHAVQYPLLTNYRSKKNIIHWNNQIIQTLESRLKNYEIRPAQSGNGSIEIHQYKHPYFFPSFLDEFQRINHSGTTAILTHRNDDAALIDAGLRHRGYSTQLVAHNNFFKIKYLQEFQHFNQHIIGPASKDQGFISEALWLSAKSFLEHQFRKSHQLPLVLDVLADYEKNYPKKYLYEWQQYLQETNPEDFISSNHDKLVVTTMHKSKGHEFDQVFLLLNDFKITDDKTKRLVYVASSRAKNLLYIFTNHSFFDEFHSEGISRQLHPSQPAELEKVELQLHHSDINLGWFKINSVAIKVKKLQSGDMLKLDEAHTGLSYQHQELILKFSKNFIKQLHQWKEKGYSVEQAQVVYTLIWWDKEQQKSVDIFLPKLRLSKIKNFKPENHYTTYVS